MKRILAVVLSALLFLGAVPAAAFSTNGYQNGDGNQDGNLSVKDATLIQRSVAKLTTLSEVQERIADVNLDGSVNIKDATVIQKVVAKIEEMPSEPNTEPVTQGETMPVETEDIGGLFDDETTAPTEASSETSAQPEETAPNPEVSSNINVYFTNNKNWSKVYFFLYNTETGDGVKEWPGVQITKYTTNTNGEKVYSSTVDVSKYDRIIFNDGANNQTVNVPVNRASSGFYIYENSSHTAKEKLVGTYAYNGADKGALKELSFDYPMGYKKKVWIWTPADYDPNSKEPYKTVYMPDGQNIFDFKNVAWGGWEVSDAVESLMSNGGRGMILVGIESTGTRRDTELTPNLGDIQTGVGNQYKNGKGKEFSDFVVNTVMPYVRENYRSSTARADNIVAGSSPGGLEAFYIGMENHDKFSAIGAFSPAFIIFGDEVWNNYLSKFDLKSKEDMPKVYIYDGKVGLEDTLYPYIVDMKDRLSKSGYGNDIKFVIEENAEHNEAWWRVVYPEFLDWTLYN